MAQHTRGRKTPIQLGNLSSVRDWGYAPEFILAMEKIINAKNMDDYIVATNEVATVRDFFNKTFKILFSSSLPVTFYRRIGCQNRN